MRRSRNTSQRESGIAHTRRLMREQRCHSCEGRNPDISRSVNGKTKHFHTQCM
jgi:hypothetical protein